MEPNYFVIGRNSVSRRKLDEFVSIFYPKGADTVFHSTTHLAFPNEPLGNFDNYYGDEAKSLLKSPLIKSLNWQKKA